MVALLRFFLASRLTIVSLDIVGYRVEAGLGQSAYPGQMDHFFFMSLNQSKFVILSNIAVFQIILVIVLLESIA